MSTLQRELGAPLLVRGPSGDRPTAAGATFAVHADAVLAAMRAASDAVR